jgi:transposase
MHFVGIDVGAEGHVAAVVDEAGGAVGRPLSFAEDASGYAALLARLGAEPVALVGMEATGHYWRNLFAALSGHGYPVVLLNALRTRRFAGEDLQRTKTDAVDAVTIARFLQQKRPSPTPLAGTASEALRELVRHRDRLVQDFGDRLRQLHRLVDLVFPELTRHVGLDSRLANELLRTWPTAAALRAAGARRIAQLRYDGRHRIGPELAVAILEDASRTVGTHAGSLAYGVPIRQLCEALDLLRRHIGDLDRDIDRLLEESEIGRLLTTIDGIGPNTAARLIAELGDPARFANAKALACYVGVIPALRQSGKRQSDRGRLTMTGHLRLRRALWMPTLTAVKRSAWLRAYYQGLRRRGKPAKVALIAAMRKLLAAVYSVAKHRRPFVDRPATA